MDLTERLGISRGYLESLGVVHGNHFEIRESLFRHCYTVIVDLELVISSVKSNDRSGLRLSINQSFILTLYVKVLENSFKIRTCINKIHNNYSYVMILFNVTNIKNLVI